MGKGWQGQVEDSSKSPVFHHVKQSLHVSKEYSNPTKETELRAPTGSVWLYCFILANRINQSKWIEK